MFDVIGLTKQLIKQISRRDVLVIFLIFIAFLFTRLINLDKFPIFSDEGIYIHWAKVAWKDATWRFISLTDGRQPLQTWMTIPFLKIFEHNALLAGRLFAVSGGLFALTGLISTCWYLFGKRTGFIAGILYIITPYFLFYDRIALADSMINGFTIWIFFLSILLGKLRRLDVAMILGLTSGFALLAKSSVKLYVGFAFFAIIFSLYEEQKGGFREFILMTKEKIFGKKNKRVEIFNFVFLYGIVVFLSILIYNVQRLSPFLHFVTEKNKTFVLTFSELMHNPTQLLPHNLFQIPYYIFSEMGYVVGVLALIGLYFLYKKEKILAIYVMLWLVTGLVVIGAVAKVLFPRYVLSLGGLMIIPAAYLISSISTKKYLWGVVLTILISVGYFNYTILYDYRYIPFPRIDRGQYIEDWPSGWGMKEIVSYVRTHATDKPAIIIAEGNFGMSGDVLDTFIRPGDKIGVKAYWPLKRDNLLENQQFLHDNNIYVVASHCKGGVEGKAPELHDCHALKDEWPVEPIQVYTKPGNRSAIHFFMLKTPEK